MTEKVAFPGWGGKFLISGVEEGNQWWGKSLAYFPTNTALVRKIALPWTRYNSTSALARLLSDDDAPLVRRRREVSRLRKERGGGGGAEEYQKWRREGMVLTMCWRGTCWSCRCARSRGSTMIRWPQRSRDQSSTATNTTVRRRCQWESRSLRLEWEFAIPVFPWESRGHGNGHGVVREQKWLKYYLC